MTDEQAIRKVHEDMYRAMIAKDTVALGSLLSDDSILIHMTGHRQPRKEYLAEIAAVYGGGRHTWRLQMDSELRKVDGKWKISLVCPLP